MNIVFFTKSAEFQKDWQAIQLVDKAKSAVGELLDSRCYCLKLPAVLGGTYTPENMGSVERIELIAISGDVAQ